MTRSIYIAAPTARQNHAESLALKLRAFGYEITSQWHAKALASPPGGEGMLALEARRGIAQANLEDLRLADAFVLIADPAGRSSLVELGLAWSRGLRIVIFGVPLQHSLMADLPGVVWATTLKEAVDALG
jgi:nucleoside 2-deoxyribosyltransferase